MFRASDGEGVNHKSTLYLYEDIDVDKTTATRESRGYVFVLKRKEKGDYWVRLLKSKQKVNVMSVYVCSNVNDCITN